MIVEHELSVFGVCPVNGARDCYTTKIRVKRLIRVEDLMEVIDSIPKEPMFQEQLTDKLADMLQAEVETIGHHSGVRTTCICGEAKK